LSLASNLVEVAVRRLGTYGAVTVHWSSIQARSDNDSRTMSLGTVQPSSGSITLTDRQETAVLFVEVTLDVHFKYTFILKAFLRTILVR